MLIFYLVLIPLDQYPNDTQILTSQDYYPLSLNYLP